MTACNLWLQPNAGHLVTDGAMYDADGRVLATVSKVLASSELLMAVTFLGAVIPSRIGAALEHRLGLFGRSQATALASLVPVAADLREANRREHPELETAGLNGFALLAVVWDQDAGYPRGWIVQTDDCRQTLAQPWTLHETFGYSTPKVPLPVDMAGGRLSGIDHGRQVLEAQRRQLQPEGFSIVGGFGEVFTVTAAGVAAQRLVEWPDVIGERIAA